MATFNLRRFTRPEILGAIQAQHLCRLLTPFAGYFASRDVTLPEASSDAIEPLPCEAIARVLIQPDGAMPDALVEALYYIHEMATPEGLEAIMEALDETPVGFDHQDEATALDMAIQIWLENPRLLERLHEEQKLTRPRTFEYFCSETEELQMREPDEDTLRQIESELNEFFSRKKRGRTARVYYYGRPGEAWFLIRHGEPFRHEPVLEGGEMKHLLYRPVKYDVFVFSGATGEIRINTPNKGQREQYRLCFGRHLFGDETCFNQNARFTLDPLTTDGQASLVCSDVPGIEWIRLKEVQLFWGGEFHEIEIRKADDVFASLERRGKTLPPHARIIRAGFSVQFESSNKPRSFSINSRGRLDLKRDDDSQLIELWMRRRGFIRREEETHGAEATSMAVA